ncbi:hypothetical protein PDM28_18335 [Stenotrophomonas aracearum]|jgi:hypothetical protein|uniref:Uncharacterized protein n=1 Tax=Stenotrophomonas aracearum TaxID=3003272 RepID=A0ABY9YCU0_9GAMM|nr:hypothetical protein [Stenotrophomonas sp. A5588]WNH48591.1 hypothetical protein PDM28_18335 [Stenotrophomonas sp. A5588]
MSVAVATEAHRRCALLLAPLHPRDQSALIAALPSSDEPLVRQVLRELLASSLPIDAVSAEGLEAGSSVQTDLPAVRIDWNTMAGRVSSPWLARGLTCLQGAEREFCIAALEPASRAAVVPMLANVSVLPTALEASLRRHLLDMVEAG